MNFVKNISTIILIIFLTSCKSKEVTSTKIPFEITNATYNYWYGGREGVRGIAVKIAGTNLKKKIVFNTLYYKDKKAKIYTEIKENKLLLSANIDTSNRRIDHKNHASPQEEYGNKAPIKPKYNLKEGEAVIEYTQKNKELFFKITLSKKEAVYYP